MMQISDGYQQPGGTTVVVVQQPQPWYSTSRAQWANRGPNYMRHGIQLGGVALSFPIIICLGGFGGLLVFSGIMTMATARHDPEFWGKFNRSVDPSVTAGTVMLVIGGLLIAACIALACYAKKKYKNLNSSSDNPGRVINRNPNCNPQQQQPLNPGQPGGALPYGMNPGMSPYPQGSPRAPMGGGYAQPPMGGGYAQPPVGSYPPSPSYPPPCPTPPGALPPYQPSPSAGMKAYPPQAPDYTAPALQVPPYSGTGMTQDPTKPTGSEYDTPPAYAPGFPSKY